MKYHHIGIAVFNIEETAPFYIMQGYSKSQTVYDPIQHVNICFLTDGYSEIIGGGGMPMIELIEPIDEKSPVYKILQKSGVAPYHICYEVENISDTITELKREKFIPLSKPVEAIAINNKKVCFLFNKNIGLIELVEK
ncbi:MULTISPECIES: VOC family protein [unclassified Treponema]|uniref:VOC family protein n=1 Tax=unclassified Treponema TaxID=2638727 RepID=UPI0020A53A3D|nr:MULTISPECIES: VOC family protein [unclassified Treponema]UTC68219.1 VOC family protein [Treponema sp. OMZ 789]UTC70939.1 VOC family protein [Treponema sp. OMZ 790]UTC73679.1 VOC family protein [Treponema sp. OMZ 791]